MTPFLLVRLLVITACIIGISLLHYLTPLHLPMLHDIFQRLYYLPIILAAFWFGVRGGLTSSIAVSILYAPHILFQWGAHPSLELEKYLEIVLYNIMGGVIGLLSQREEARRAELEKTAKGLEELYNKLQAQTDLVLEIEEQLRQSERLSALGELSAILAHEIRNPLGSIKGTAEILKDSFRPEEPKYEFLQILLNETDRLNRVVENFLGLARPLNEERSCCDLMHELKETVAMVSVEASSRGVSIELEPAALPPIKGDREKLRQVFLNLIMNSLQASARGSTIHIYTTKSESIAGTPATVSIFFVDSGEGIPSDILDRIFTPFFTTKPGGTGLGLAITRKIIENHNGTIKVSSEKGSGTTFVVTLPA